MGRYGSDPHRRAGERGQGRAAPRAVSRRARPRSGPDRAEPVGRRARRARAARALRRAARRLDRHVRRPLRADRRGADGARAGRDRRAARARARARGRSRDVAERPRPLGALRAASPTRCATTLARARVGPARAGQRRRAISRRLYAAYRAELDRLGLWDRDLLRRRAAERARGRARRLARRARLRLRLRGPDRRREWALLEALAGRTEVTVSLPYEPGRAGVRVAAPHAGGPRRARGRADRGAAARATPSRARRRSRTSSARSSTTRARPAAAARRRDPLLRGRGHARRARARRGGGARAAPRRHAARGDRARLPVARALARAARDRASARSASRTRSRAASGSAQTAFGQALLSLLRFAWLGGGRARALRASSARRTRASPRSNVDFLEGRLRGRGDRAPERVEAETIELRDGQPLPPLDALRAASDAASRPCARSPRRCCARAHGLEAPPVGDAAPRRPARATTPCCALLDELDGWERARRRRSRADDVVGRARARRRSRLRSAGERGPRRRPRPRRARARAASRSSSCSASRRGACRAAATPRRSSTTTRAASSRRGAARAARPGRARPLPLLHGVHARRRGGCTSCARRRPTRAARASRARSGTRSRALFDARRRRAAGRGGGRSRQLTWPLEEAPTERERLRALALARATTSRRRPTALARANGWERRLERARARVRRGRRGSRHPRVLAELGGADDVQRHRARALRRLLVGLVLRAADRPEDDRRRGRREAARLGRAHDAAPLLRAACRRSSAPTASTETRSTTRSRSCARCLDEALAGRADGDDRAAAARARRRALWRDLEAFVRDEARSRRCRSCRAASRSSFGSERSAPELQRGLDLGDGLTLSGKIDRIDVDPFSARGIVQDYKSGKHAPLGGARSRRSCGSRSRSTCSCCATSSGSSRSAALYRPLAGERTAARAAPRRGAGRRLPGFVEATTTSTRTRSGRRSRRARRTRARLAQRIRAGDVRHDPKGGDVPDVVRPLADVPGEARVRSLAPNPSRPRRSTRAGSVFVSAGAGTGKTTVLVERFVARGLRARARRRLDARDHVHAKRAPASCARASARALLERGRARSRARARRRLDLDDPRLLHAAAEGVPVRGRARPALPRARRGAGRACSAARRSRRRSTSSAPASEPERLRLLATYGARRPAADADRRLRDAALGRPRARARARRARPSLADARRRARATPRAASPTTPTRPTLQRADAAQALELVAGRRRCPSVCSTSRRSGRAASARATYEEARKAVEQAALDELAAARPRAAAGAARRLRRRVRGGEGPRVGARLRGPPARARATCCATNDDDPRARAAALPRRSWSTSSRTRTGSSAS